MVHSTVRPLGALAFALTLAACQGTGANAPSTAAGDVRVSTATAPADLQLLCASAASAQLGVPSNAVLPTSSAPIPDGYQVTLTLTGGVATCAVRNDGTVVSVERV